METMFAILVFVFGLVVGSFLNVVIVRLPTEKGFIKGRSHCVHCKKTLRWFDLIPIVSFLLLWGQCRYCKKNISLQYPLVELATGLIFLLIFNQWQSVDIRLFLLFYVAGSLIIIFVYDLKHYIIPDVVLFPAIIAALPYHLSLNYLLSALVAAGFFLGIFLVSRGRWMGFGDVKLAVLLGLLLGFPNIFVGLFLAFILGAMVGVVSIFSHKKGLKSEMPFAPFLILGTFLAYFWGTQIIFWYTQFFLF